MADMPINALSTVIEEDIRMFYSFSQKLESSSQSGALHNAIHKITGESFQIRSIPKSNQNIQKQLRELEALKSLDHPCIVKLVQAFEDENFYHLVIQNQSGQELFNLIENEGPLDEAKTAQVMYRLLQTAAYCHSMGVAHRDIKPEKVIIESFFPDPQIKLSGFEFCGLFDPKEQMTTPVGTPAYLAPEVLSGSYGPEVDCWSLGVVMYIVMSGFFPFEYHDIQDIIKDIPQVNFDFTEWDNISHVAKDLITKLLQTGTRISASEALNHQFFNEHIPAPQLNPSVLQQIKQFDVKNKFHKEILTHIATNHLSSAEIQEYVDTFRAIDSSSLGFITKEKLTSAFIKNSDPLLEDEINELFNKLDYLCKGKIQYSDFLTACINFDQINRPSLLYKVFKFYDVRGGNRISPENVKSCVRQGMKQINSEEAKKIVREHGMQGDRRVIRFADFTNLLVNVPYDENSEMVNVELSAAQSNVF